MARIPVIVGFGGINPAGRSSFHHGYNRMVIDSLGAVQAQRTYASLAALMGRDVGAIDSPEARQYLLDHTLIRRIEPSAFDVASVDWNHKLGVKSDEAGVISFVTRARTLPDPRPANWTVSDIGGGQVRVEIRGDADIFLPMTRQAPVQSAGQLPSGFDPGGLYPARSHPRGLQMSIVAASDTLHATGIGWEQVCQLLRPDQISVYAGSAMGQLDFHGHGGMIGARYNAKRTTSKNCPLGLAEMSADFINAYVLGSVGSTGTNVGACASFLYNLRQGIWDIQSGRARAVLVGGSEAPVVADVMDGYTAMGALATDQELLALDADKGLVEPDYRRASRPFSSNCGFTIAESAQFVMLFDDELAMELGASIYGAVTDVYVNADGHKKSIAGPGVGNYLTMAKAMAAVRSMLGEESLQQRSFVQAHGTSTPQNRVTESHIMNEMARTFGIQKWPVAAIKAYVGHSLGPAAADQLMSSLGVWSQGLIPGIRTIDHVADDVYQSNLSISAQHTEVGVEGIDSVILNSKGFGGNNASAAVLAPHIVKRMLQKKHGSEAWLQHQRRHEVVAQRAAAYDDAACRGAIEVIYKFDHQVMDGEDLQISDSAVAVPGYGLPVDLTVESPYKDLL